MKIYTNIPKKSTINDVPAGDLFAVGAKNELYLKTDIYNRYSEDWVAISIRTGASTVFDKDAPVKLVESIRVKFEK